MPYYDKFYPDYKKLYPGVHISKSVQDVLRKSDRKMKYAEYDLKCETFVQNQETLTAAFLPAREDSYERLTDEEHKCFVSDTPSPEDSLLQKERILSLRIALLKLTQDEVKLIHALFFDGVTEREYADMLGISQKGVNKRCHKVLEKLREMLE